MFLRTGLPMYGCVRWKNTAITQNLKNVQNASFSRGAEVVLRLRRAKTVIFTLRIHSAGKKYSMIENNFYENQTMNIENNKIMETIMHRRSIRRFDNRIIEDEKLYEILQAGLACICR